MVCKVSVNLAISFRANLWLMRFEENAEEKLSSETVGETEAEDVEREIERESGRGRERGCRKLFIFKLMSFMILAVLLLKKKH